MRYVEFEDAILRELRRMEESGLERVKGPGRALVWKATKGSAQVVNHTARAANELLTSFGD